MSERRNADETRAGTVDDERAGAAGRRAIAARDADADDETAVAGATRTPADERREIIVLRIEEGSAQEKEDKSVGIEKSCVFFSFLSRCSPLSKTTTAEQGRVKLERIDWLRLGDSFFFLRLFAFPFFLLFLFGDEETWRTWTLSAPRSKGCR